MPFSFSSMSFYVCDVLHLVGVQVQGVRAIEAGVLGNGDDVLID